MTHPTGDVGERCKLSRVFLAIRIKRKLNSTDVIGVLTDLLILRGVLVIIRSDIGSEFVAQTIRDWINAVGAKKAYTCAPM